jgi:hypothetical protein
MIERAAGTLTVTHSSFGRDDAPVEGAVLFEDAVDGTSATTLSGLHDTVFAGCAGCVFAANLVHAVAGGTPPQCAAAVDATVHGVQVAVLFNALISPGLADRYGQCRGNDDGHHDVGPFEAIQGGAPCLP